MRNDTLRIAIDLDGVVYNFIDEFRNYLINERGYDAGNLPEEYNTWEYYKTWNLTDQEYWSFFFEGAAQSKILTNGEVIPGAKEGLQRIKDLGCEIVIITAREANTPELTEHIRQSTLNWLDENGIVFDELILANNKANQEFHILFDDGPHNIESVAAQGRPACFFDQPWNRSIPGYDRVVGWDQLVEAVELGILPAFNEWKAENARTVSNI